MNNPEERSPHIWRSFLRMLRQVKLPLLLIFLVFLLTLGESQIKLILPEKLAEITAIGAITGNRAADTLISLLLVAFGIGLLELLVRNIIVYFNAVTKAKVHRALQRLAVDKLFSLRLSDIERKDPREFVSRITTDTGHCVDFFQDFFINEPSRLYFIVATLIKISALKDIGLILGTLSVIPLSILFGCFLGRITFSSQNRYQAVNAQLTAKLSEKVSNTELIKAYGTEEYEKESGDAIIEKLRKAARKVALVSHTTSLIAGMSFLVPVTVVLCTGASALLAGRITNGEFVLYITLSAMLRDYVTPHIQLWAFAKKAQGATARLSAILELPSEQGGQETEKPSGDISFDHVSFAYDGKLVLDDVSFTAPQGKKTALVGYSGSGKSTVLHLLEQFYRPLEGTITIGGKDIARYDLGTYRGCFAYLPQNAPGFQGSIRDMLNYGAKEPYSDDKLIEAIEAVSLDKVVQELGGLDYQIGEHAGKLSGGQRQRLSVARLLLSPGEYVLLDEATSALDKHAGEQLKALLDDACAGKTRLLVAHSLEQAMDADQILVFDRGRLIGSGTHKELLGSCRQYQELVKQQKEG